MSLCVSAFWDISSHCNAKCPYCTTGRINRTGNGNSGCYRYITTDLFARIIARIKQSDFIPDGSLLSLYCWGEPFLHPQIPELMRIASTFPFRIGFSTNASVVPKITDDFRRCVSRIIFSCPGFSNASYTRINGFDFEKIQRNIIAIVNESRKNSCRIEFVMNFHIYQFNLDEIAIARTFCRKHNIRFAPNLAILNDWSLTDGWIQRDLPSKDIYRIASELFNSQVEDILHCPTDSRPCPQYDLLVLDHEGNINICCQTPPQTAFQLSNILDDRSIDFLRNRQESVICRECITSRKRDIFNTSMQIPEFALNPPPGKLRRIASRVFRTFRLGIQ